MAAVRDTTDDAQAVMTAGLRRFTGAERLARASSLRATTLALARAGLSARHGELSEREIRRRLASSWLGADVIRALSADER
jgi:hypothetical protein